MKLSNIEFMAQAIVELKRVECDFIEYKKSVEQRASILKTACAYANNYMNREVGLILIGVEEMDEETGEKAVPKRPVIGIDEAKLETTENVLKSLLAEVHPRIAYHLLDVEVDSRKVLVVAVEPGSDGPYETSQRAEHDKGIRLRAGRYIRVRRDTRLPNRREEFELLKKFADFHFSSELNETATLDDLNYEWMREYLVRTGAAQDVRALPKLEMAQALGLVSDSEYGVYRAKNFAVLMFADCPQDFIPYARVEIIREAKDTDKMEATVFDGPIWMQVLRAKDFFEEVIQRSYTVREEGLLGHRMVYNWPETTFAELLTNAVLHKEYDKREYVGVYVYEDTLSFINHNRPLPPVTIEDMNTQEEFRDREYLNPELKEMFHALGLIESYGSGIRRAKHAMAENGNPPLLFEPLNDTDDYTMVTCPINEEYAYIRDHEDVATRKTGTTPTTQEASMETTPIGVGATEEEPVFPDETPSKRAKTTPNTQERSATTTPVDRESTPKEYLPTPKTIEEEANISTYDRILILIATNPLISAKDMGDMLGITRDGVRYHLRNMVANGKIKHEGSSRNGRWVIVDKEDNHA